MDLSKNSPAKGMNPLDLIRKLRMSTASDCPCSNKDDEEIELSKCGKRRIKLPRRSSIDYIKKKRIFPSCDMREVCRRMFTKSSGQSDESQSTLPDDDDDDGDKDEDDDNDDNDVNTGNGHNDDDDDDDNDDDQQCGADNTPNFLDDELIKKFENKLYEADVSFNSPCDSGEDDDNKAGQDDDDDDVDEPDFDNEDFAQATGFASGGFEDNSMRRKKFESDLAKFKFREDTDDPPCGCNKSNTTDVDSDVLGNTNQNFLFNRSQSECFIDNNMEYKSIKSSSLESLYKAISVQLYGTSDSYKYLKEIVDIHKFLPFKDNNINNSVIYSYELSILACQLQKRIIIHNMIAKRDIIIQPSKFYENQPINEIHLFLNLDNKFSNGQTINL